MKHLLLFLLFVSPITGFAQTGKQAEFEKTLQEIVAAVSKRDTHALAAFIDPKTGVYLLNRIGVYDNYDRWSKDSFHDSIMFEMAFRYSAGITAPALKYESLPVYDCGEEKWNKQGFFADTTKRSHQLSEICTFRNKYVPDTIPQKTISAFRKLENKSRKVVLCASGNQELVIFVSLINGKWMLTVIDTVSSDCSA